MGQLLQWGKIPSPRKNTDKTPSGQRMQNKKAALSEGESRHAVT
jgi:hypothetical protein